MTSAPGANEAADTPRVLVFPPVLFASCLGAGIALELLWPLSTGLSWPIRWGIAAIVFAVGTVLGFGGERALHAAGTNVRPNLPTTALVASGVYRYTRNPLYLALLCAYTAIAVLVNTLWPLVLWAVLLPVLHVGIVRREERYLERKFGDEYRAYMAKVRRWI